MSSTFHSAERVGQPHAPSSETVHYATLAALPEGVAFPAELQDRIWFEPGKSRLAFRGFMSKAAFDRLQSLHANPEYRRSLDLLFRASTSARTAELNSGSARRWPVAAMILATIAVIGAMLLLLFN